jgi:hypothetical protein
VAPENVPLAQCREEFARFFPIPHLQSAESCINDMIPSIIGAFRVLLHQPILAVLSTVSGSEPLPGAGT